MNKLVTDSYFNIKNLSRFFISIVVLIAIMVLFGWQFNINAFKRIYPFLSAMNPLTAVCFLFISISFFNLTAKNKTLEKRFMGRLILSVIIIACSLKLLDIWFNINFAIDHVLFREKIDKDIHNGISSNMAANTAIGILVSAASLLFFEYKTKGLWIPYQILAILVFSFGFFSLLGYVYGAPEFYDLLKYVPMSVYTSICFICISLAILLANPDVGIVKEFTGSLTGSSVGPVLLFSAFTIPFFLGLVRVYTHKVNLFSTELGIALLVLTINITFCILVLWNVILLNKKDLLRKRIEDKFRSLIESAPDAIIIIDGRQIIQLINFQTETMFGFNRNDIVGRPIDLLIPQISQLNQLEFVYKMGVKSPFTKEFLGLKKSGIQFPIETSMSPLETEEQILTSISIRDTTERKKQEEISWNNQELFRTLVTNVIDYAIFMLDIEGNIVTWNKGAEIIKGYKREEVVGKHISIFYLPEDKGVPKEMLAEADRKGKCEREGWRKRKNGSVFWADVILTALYDQHGLITGYAKVTRDFTDKKKYQDTLSNFNKELSNQVGEKTREIEETTKQLRQLSAHLQTAREEERKYIAREMHDELGQMITGLRMDIVWLKKRISSNDDVVLLRFERAIELVNDVKQAMRRIALDLHPAVLNDLGLITALKVHGNDFENRSGIKTVFDIELEGLDDLKIDPNVSIGLYRIFQESLNNIVKHANANQVNSSLKLNGENLEFVISDNGKGFNLNEVANKKSLGLISMRERMLMIDGQCQIQSSSETGTTIYLTVPIKFK